MAKNKSMAFRTSINLICGVGVLVVNTLVSFFLSPYIIRAIGVEANGFVNLANNFVYYANLVVIALNAMAARFITISYVNEDYKKANMYYNSVFWGNLIIDAVLLLPVAFFIGRIEYVINVPENLVWDVRILFGVILLSFFVRTGAPNYDCGTYVTNRMDLSYIPSMATALLRCVMLFGMFSLLAPHVWYVGFTSMIISFITLGVAGHFTHKLTPELKVVFKKPICSGKAIKELVGSGIWSAFAIAGSTMMNGLDLIVCNLALGVTEMGVLSVSKSIPAIMTEFTETLRGAFGPELTLAYAQGHKETVLSTIRRSMKITAVVVSIPTAGIIVMSDALYMLWQPTLDAHLLQILTILAVLDPLVCNGVSVLNNVFVTANKVKYNAYASLITGFASIGITLLFVNFTDYGLYAVAGVSSVMMIIKNLTFMLPITAHFLGFKWYQFYPNVLTSIICSGLNVFVGLLVRHFLPVNGWVTFFLACMIIAFIGLCINMMIVLNKGERAYLMKIIKRKSHERDQ